MLQLAYALVGLLIVSVSVLWVLGLFVLLPWYRGGKVQGPHRTMFQLAAVLLGWVTTQIVVWLFMHADALAMMFNVLWAIALLTWATFVAVGRTRRQVFEQRTAAAQPAPQTGGWTVISAPAAARARARARAPLRPGYSGPSQTVRNIEAMEVTP